ncbi:MAG: hypothetical protein ACLP01_20960 [Solirubrobacteraceae bacterium]
MARRFRVQRTIKLGSAAWAPLISKTMSDPTESFTQLADDLEAAADQEGA